MRFLRALLVGSCAPLLAGCLSVDVYQPLSGLQRPVAVNTGVANFGGMRLLVNCVPGDFLSAAENDELCRKLETLFGNQGAEVRAASRGAALDDGEEPFRPDLTIDLAARLIDEQKNPLLWTFAVPTGTLLPGMTELTFAQDVTIRDGQGFLLVSDTMKGRFVRYYGVGAYGLNWLLDVLVREDEDELCGDGAKEDFSRDYYGQLSQLVFNANVRRRVLHTGAAAAR